MRRLRHICVLLAALAAVGAGVPASALAAGCGNSAGDQQYVDPLQNCNNPSPGSSGTHTTPSSSTGSQAPAPVATPASSTTATSSSAAQSPNSGSGATLPYTGLDLPAALLVAAALLGGGLVLARVARGSS